MRILRHGAGDTGRRVTKGPGSGEVTGTVDFYETETFILSLDPTFTSSESPLGRFGPS